MLLAPTLIASARAFNPLRKKTLRRARMRMTDDRELEAATRPVRSHIKRLLVKSGTSRQAELVALLSRIAIPFVLK